MSAHLEIISTQDGSPTVLNKQLNATYHSSYGAMQESLHIFIEHGLLHAVKTMGKDLNVFEVGFGTGLNALLTLQEAKKRALGVNYTAVEKFPLEPGFALQLNYNDAAGTEREEFNLLHALPWEKNYMVSENFSMCKHGADINNAIFPENVHLVFFDAFAPSSTPEMWTTGIFEKLHGCMTPGGILVTFCAKGDIKRLLKRTGFVVETLPGPPGKREMTRALKAS